MNDSYQAIYDAVRSRIGGGNIGEAVTEIARQCFDISYSRERVVQEICIAASAMTDAANQHARPSAVYKPTLSRDGNQWCLLYGCDYTEGVAGFGDTPEAAAQAFDRAWLNEKARAMTFKPSPRDPKAA
jgi:hypothetical protein